MPPGSQYRLVHLENGIVAGGFLYASTQLQSICQGIVNTFIDGDTVNFKKRTKTCLALLRRILAYAHEVIG